MDMGTVEILNRGMKCLVENMGLVEAEFFVSAVMREKFDYTKWQRDYFDKKTPQQIDDEALKHSREHPYQGNARVII